MCPLALPKRGGIRPNNTTVTVDGEGYTVCTLHQTQIAVLSRNGRTVNLYTGGFNTPTTIRRMNECLHVWGFTKRVSKRDFCDTERLTLLREKEG
jgi:hypothetical protein